MRPIALALLLPLLAQTPTLIQGEIQDTTGSAITGATVTAANPETGQRRAAQSNVAGQFTLNNLPIGTWTLTVAAKGFGVFKSEPFLLSVGQSITRRFVLQPADVVERLEVNETIDGVDAAAANASVALGYERIEEAPARSRNYLNFVLSAPSVAPSAGGSSQRTMTGTRSVAPDTGFTFAGIRPRNNSIQIDGMDNRDETTGGNRVAVGLEMIQEFRVAATSVGSELGGAAGGILNVVTRSGVNLLHGDATFFTQQSPLNAQKPEVESTLDPGFTRYQPGVSGMGPLQKDRTFLASALEVENERADELSNVPAEFDRGLYPTSTRGMEFSAKLDHHQSDKGAVMTRYAFSRGRTIAEVQGPDNFAARSAQGSSLTADHSLVGSWMRVLNPSTVNDARAQFAQREVELTPNGAGPQIDIPGIATIGAYHRMNSRRTERHYQFIDNFNFTHGAHRFSSGVDIHHITLDSTIRDRFAGIFVFPTLAAYRARQPDLYIKAFGDPRTRITTTPAGAWLHDRWQIRQRVNFEFGVRYDHQRTAHNVAPRAGVSWRPLERKPLVIRAGAGLFFDRYPLGFLNHAVQNKYELFATGAQATQAFAGVTPNVSRSTYSLSSDFPSTHSRKLSIGAEYGIDKDTSLTIEASNIRGLHLPRMRNIAGVYPPRFLLEQTARSAYTGFTVSANRRLSNELAWLVSWTHGRTHDDGSDYDEQPQNPFDIRADWGPSRQDQRNRLAASAIFELPFLEGVSFAPIFTWGAGRPINQLLASDVYRTGAYPITARPPGVARNPYLSPKQINLDLRVMKTIEVLNERALFQFGVESFNLLNHTNVERVSQWAGPRYGGILESLPARQIQLMTQFEF
ncbi:MAG: hypothetical protein FJW32_04390 [Acidobacteria bacterium]|nr:hypothetical protein [Acidobacteriota bacterium]